MIDYEYLDSSADAIVDLYRKAEEDIINDMAERIAAFDWYGSAVQFQEQKLQEMGFVHNYIVDQLSRATNKSVLELNGIIRRSGAEVLKTNIWLKHFGFDLTDVDASDVWRDRLAVGLKKTSLLFTNLTATTAATATRQFERALDRAYMQIETGAFSYQTAIKRAVKSLAAQGVKTVEYHNGLKTTKTDEVDVAVRRAVLTGVNQTTAGLQLAVNEELGLDLVEVSAHEGARPEHADWQGKIYSLSGTSKKYKDFYAATGYGTGAGLCGWNCRHTFYPYVEGANRVWPESELNKLNEKTVNYNGEKYTYYEATQYQREIERNIRKWKREANALKAAGVPNNAEVAKVEQWNHKLNDFTKQTGFKKQYDRTYVGATVEKTPVRATQEQKEAVLKAARKNDPANMSNLVKILKSNGVKEVETKKYVEQPTMEQIISKLGGADKTTGSCSSLALAYAGNRNGTEVLDFRGGYSREFFSQNNNINAIMHIDGINGTVLKRKSDFESANELLATVQEGHEYYFGTGYHAAVVRKTGDKLEFLELQSATNNGWHELTQERLKNRFGCKKYHKSYGQYYELESQIADVANFKGNTEFEELLKYINTPEDKQLKGYGGGIK